MPYSLSEKERKRTREQEREPLDCHTEAKKMGIFFVFIHSVFTHTPRDGDGEKRCTQTERKQEKEATAKEL